MKNTWAIIANSATARIYQIHDHGKQLELVKELEHPESRLRINELVSDHPGRYVASNANAGTYAEPTNPKEVVAEQFAHQLAKELEAAHVNNQYDHLLIYATPHFHGLLNKQLNKTIHQLSKNIQKDYTAVPAHELPEIIKRDLAG